MAQQQWHGGHRVRFCSHHCHWALSHSVTTDFKPCRPHLFPPTLQVAANGETPDQRSPPFSWNYGMMPDRQPALTSLVIAMAQTDDGKIWLGTERRGLFYLQEDRVFSALNGTGGYED